jgi:hypothetical protein
VRHEYWEWEVRRGQLYRWEFLDRLNKQPWPYDNLSGHLECFQRILRQYGINSFPKSYTPPGNGYHYAPQSAQDSGTLFSSFGVKYAMCNMNETIAFGTPQSVVDAGGVIHNGLLWIQEAGIKDDPNWPLYNAIGAVPPSIPADGIPLTIGRIGGQTIPIRISPLATSTSPGSIRSSSSPACMFPRIRRNIFPSGSIASTRPYPKPAIR